MERRISGRTLLKFFQEEIVKVSVDNKKQRNFANSVMTWLTGHRGIFESFFEIASEYLSDEDIADIKEKHSKTVRPDWDESYERHLSQILVVLHLHYR